MMDEIEREVACTFEGCVENPIGKCNECKLAYCLEHASEVDPAHFCCNCLVPADTSVEEKPLIDVNGVKHTGRVIHPVGRSYRAAEKLIDQMNDDELREHIAYCKQQVAQLSSMKLHWEINLNLAEMKAWHGQVGDLAKFGGELRVGTSSARLTRNAPRKARATHSTASGVGKVDKTVELLNALGLKPADLVALINAIPKKK